MNVRLEKLEAEGKEIQTEAISGLVMVPIYLIPSTTITTHHFQKLFFAERWTGKSLTQ